MSVYKAKGSKTFRYDFWCGGYRFVGNCGLAAKTKRQAQGVERKAKAEAKARRLPDEAAKGGPMKLDLGAVRYYNEVGQHRAAPETILTNLNRLIAFFGKGKRLSDISDDDVAKLIAWRRGHSVDRHRKKPRKDKAPEPFVAPATVNRSTLEPLKKVFNRAKRSWGMTFKNEPNWGAHKLAEPKERVRILRADETERLEQAARGDYEPYWRFLDASGLRLSEGLLKWHQV